MRINLVSQHGAHLPKFGERPRLGRRRRPVRGRLRRRDVVAYDFAASLPNDRRELQGDVGEYGAEFDQADEATLLALPHPGVNRERQKDTGRDERVPQLLCGGFGFGDEPGGDHEAPSRFGAHRGARRLTCTYPVNTDAPLRSHSTTKELQSDLESEAVQRVGPERKVGDKQLNIKELNPEGSPQAAFGARLRGLREQRGWTQEELGARMEYSSTHMSAVETGRKLSTLRFSRSADLAFGTGDEFERMWREIRQGSLLEGFPQFVDHEARAAEIRLYEVGVMPGLLQTPEYASVLAESAVRRGAITPEQAEERTALVAERQDSLLRERPPLVFAVLDESCLRRPIGGSAVMDAQLARLLEFAELPNTVLQIAPFDMGELRPFSLPVYILTMSDRSLMSYAESAQRGHLERDNKFVLPVLTSYHQLQAEALSQAESVAMIEQLRKGTP